MGLISEYGKDLIGKIFIWQCDFYLISPGDVWLIGRITGFRSERFSIYKSPYEVLLSNHTSRLDGEFYLDSEIDRNSILICNSSGFRKYLELFCGIN